MHQFLPCLWYVINLFYPLKEKKYREKAIQRNMMKSNTEKYVIRKSNLLLLCQWNSVIAQGTLQYGFPSNVFMHVLGSSRFQLYVEFY